MQRWPDLDDRADRAVVETIHAYLQVIGKMPVRSAPWLNHGWHVALTVSPRGFRTHVLPVGDIDLELTFDCRAGAVSVSASNGRSAAFALTGQTVRAFKADLEAVLALCDGAIALDGAPNEVEAAMPFDRDDRPRPFDAARAQAVHGAFLSADRVFRAFRTGFLGKSSPSHLFWGGFDLAATRFSGRTAPRHPGGFPNLSDDVTCEAYSHEVISAGFWPGGNGLAAAFYAYAYPAPDGLASASVMPIEASWNADLGEFLLPYAAVQAADDPDAMLIDFLQSTYAAAADLAGWDRNALDVPIGTVGRPRAL